MRYLADVNVLLAILVDGHPHHQQAMNWWQDCQDGDIALVLPVHMALLRLLTNKSVMGSSQMSNSSAWKYVNLLRNDPRIQSNNCEISQYQAAWFDFVKDRQPSPNLWTDAWLAATAKALNLTMVTFDKDFKKFAHLNLMMLKGAL